MRGTSVSVTGGVRPHSEKCHFLLFSRLLVRQDSPSLSPRLETSRAAGGGCEDQERATGGIAGIAGLKVCIDYRDFKLGLASQINMEEAAKNSRHTIAV